jgi:hypothetical protein
MLAKLAYGIVGLAIVALSFSGTLYALNQWSYESVSEPLYTSSIATVAPPPIAAPAPGRAANIDETSLDALPRLQALGFKWVGVARLNVRAESGAPVVAGQPILRLTPTSQTAPHTLAGQFDGLASNHAYRVTAWVKSEDGGNVEFELTDQPHGQVIRHAAAVFNLSTHVVQNEDTTGKPRGFEQGPDGWQKLWIELTTADGQIVVAVRPGGTDAKDGRKPAVLLGGVEASLRS